MTDDAARDELRFLTRALRAHLEWQAGTGATGSNGRLASRVAIRGGSVRAGCCACAALLCLCRSRVSGSTSVPVSTSVAASTAVFASSAAAAPPSISEASVLFGTPSEQPGAAVDPVRRLEVLAELARACTRCGLCKQRKQAVFARGTGSSGVCFVGEGPGADEDAQGLPFVGKAGQLLDRMIEAMGFDREQVYVCNVVKCRPPDNRKPEPDEMAACAPYLERAARADRPARDRRPGCQRRAGLARQH